MAAIAGKDFKKFARNCEYSRSDDFKETFSTDPNSLFHIKISVSGKDTALMVRMLQAKSKVLFSSHITASSDYDNLETWLD